MQRQRPILEVILLWIIIIIIVRSNSNNNSSSSSSRNRNNKRDIYQGSAVVVAEMITTTTITELYKLSNPNYGMHQKMFGKVPPFRDQKEEVDGPTKKENLHPPLSTLFHLSDGSL